MFSYNEYKIKLKTQYEYESLGLDLQSQFSVLGYLLHSFFFVAAISIFK